MSNNRKHINWGIIGCGWVARDYVAPGIVAAPNARLIALFDIDPGAMSSLIANVASQVGVNQVATHTDINDFLRTPDLDAVYIATPNHLHRTYTEAAAQAGKHVLCEKPMATAYADAERMVTACRAAGVTYATAFDQRFHACHVQLREMIRQGEFGTITLVRIHYACWTPGDWFPPTSDATHDNWRVDPIRAGGGAFIDLAPHGFDLAQHLLDSPLEEAQCLMQRRVFDYPVDDGAVAVGRFSNGALLSHSVAYNCPDEYPRRTLEIIGTKAMAIARNTMGQTPGGTLTVIDFAGATREIPIAPEEDVSPFQRQVKAFSECLLNDNSFPFPPERDLHTMHMLEAAQQPAFKLDADVAQWFAARSGNSARDGGGQLANAVLRKYTKLSEQNLTRATQGGGGE